MNPDRSEIESTEQSYPTLASGIQQSPGDVTTHLRPSGVDPEDLSQPFSSRGEIQGRLVSSQSGAGVDATQTVDATVLNVDTHLMPIKEAIWDARAKWRDIGRKLKLTEGDINAIHDRDDGECLHTVLSQWMRTGEATLHELLKVLKSKIINRSDIAEEILALKGDERVQVGLKDESSPECATVELSVVERMELALSGELTLDDVKYLLVDGVWYQLGLWLGVKEKTLNDILYGTSTVNEYLEDQSYSFDYFFRESKVNKNKLPLYQQKLYMFQDFIKNAMKRDKRKLISNLLGQQKSLFNNLLSEDNCFDAVKWSQLLAEMTDDNRPIAYEIMKQKWLKRVKIVESLVKVGCRSIAEKICTERGVSLTEYLEATDPASNPPECITRYASYLKRTYLQHFVYNSEDEWPPVSSEKQLFSNLALIITQRYASNKEIESMKHDYAHGGIDSIVAHKKHLELNEVFFPIISSDNNVSRLTILMDGAPGVGKTTIARKLCVDWAKGNMLQEYQLVLFVSLREVTDDSIASLLPSPVDEAKKVIEYLEKVRICGKYTLFILDGYDELSAENRSKQSIFMKLIGGKVLHNCSVLVTSRPYASGVLKRLPRVNRHVEILGFTTDQRNDYIGKSLIKPDVAKKLIQILNERLDIASLCYTPLNCRIILFVFEQQMYELPVTLTELYEIFNLHTIKRFQTKYEVSTHLIENVHSLNKLPETILKQLNSLSKVAYECLMKDQLFITSDDVDIVSTLPLGLLSSLKSINSRCVTNNYQFLHLTIQEFLAARWISFFAEDHKLSFIREHIDNSRLRLTLLFLAGLTKLNFITTESLIFVNNPTDKLLGSGSDNLDDEWSENSPKLDPEIMLKKLQFFLAQLAFESQTTSSENFIALEDNALDLSDFSLSSFDSYVVAYFLSSTSNDYVLSLIDFTRCGLSSDSILYRKQHYITGEPAVRKTTSLNADQIDSRLLIDIIKGCTILTHISVHYEDDSLDHDTVCLLITAMNTTKSLKVLKLSLREYGDLISKTCVRLKHVTSQLCPSSLSQLLKFVDPKYLKQLNISENPNLFKSCSCNCKEYNVFEELCSTLRVSIEIQKLQFYNCGVTDRIVEKLGPVLYDKRKLVELNLDKNDLYKFGSLLKLNSKNRLSVKMGGICLATKNSRSLPYLSKSESDISLNVLLESLIQPKALLKLRCDYKGQTLVVSINSVNQHLDFAGFSCSGHLSIFPSILKAVTNDKSLYDFKTFYGYGPSTLFRLECVTCPRCINLIVDTQDPSKLKNLSLIECSFEGCEECKAFENVLCFLIASTQVMKELNIFYCTLNEKSINSVISSIEVCCTEMLEVINFYGTTIGGESIKKLLQLMACQQNITLHVHNDILEVKNQMLIIILESDKFATYLLLPIEIIRLRIISKLLSANVLIQFIINNPQLEEIHLSNLCFSGCDEIVQLTEILKAQKSLQKIIFRSEGVLQIISRTMLHLSQCDETQRGDLYFADTNLMCPRALSNLFYFLSPDKVTILDFFNSGIFSKFGSRCNCQTSWDSSLEIFLVVLTQSMNIEKVDFSYGNLSQQTMDRIVLKLMDKPKLNEINFHQCEPTISMQSFELIFRKMIFESAVMLDLDLYILELRVRNNSELKVSCNVGAEQYVCSLLKILSQNENEIGSIHISFCGFSDNHIPAFTQVLSGLELLNLSNSRFFHNFLTNLAHFLAAHSSLRELHLNSTELTGPSAITLLNELSSVKESLEVLNLSGNSLLENCSEEQLGLAIQEFLHRNESIKTLSLSDCGLNGTVATYIANGLERNITLKELDFSIPNLSNKSEQFAQAVNKILANNKILTKLNISSGLIADDSLLYLADVLQKNSTLKELYMDSIKLPYSNAWISFFTLLKDNSSLHTLSLCDILFTIKAYKAMAEFLRSNKCMKSLKLEYFNLYTEEILTLQAEFPSIIIYSTFDEFVGRGEIDFF